MKTEDDFKEFSQKAVKEYMNSLENLENLTTEEKVNAITVLISSALKELELYTSRDKIIHYMGLSD